jgi:hypothetical protein
MMSECHTCAAVKGCAHVGNDVTHCVEYILDKDITTSAAKPYAPLETQIRAECQRMADFLVAKNRAYGNSAANPVGIFAKRADPLLGIDVRIDDKLNRLAKGSEFPGDDTITDLCGYLILRKIVAAQHKGFNPT